MGKMKTCKTCGAQIAKNAKRCPQCGAKNKKTVAIILSVVVLLIVIIAIAGILANTESDEDSDLPEVIETTTPEQNAEKEIVITENEYVKVTFQRAYEESSVSGAFYLQLLVENKSEVEIWVYLEDVYVDGSQIQAGSGTPMTIESNRDSNIPFILFYDGNLDGVDQIQFKISVTNNDTMDPLITTEDLTVML